MIITKSKMREVLANLSAAYPIAAPAEQGRVLDFLEITDISRIIMDDRITYKSPKEFFFPRCEKLLSFRAGEAVATMPKQGFAVFGAKPCDLDALATMTKVFTQGKFKDPFFAARLEQNLLIGVSCQEQKAGCFCEKLSVDRSISHQCDLFLEGTEDAYTVRYVSDKGRARLSAFIPHLNAFENQAPPPQTPPVLSVPKDADWETMTETCQSCGLCTFICPTCHCFDFKDTEQGDTADRYRIWDSCMYPKFTLHASGHNPRTATADRYRQRILHKYEYVPQNAGAIACTGCGRCIRSCPAGLDIRRMTEEGNG